ncbi:MAG: terpene cyclase/mutase family protein [Planctomycetales bacterium]|nr:terpene cyclase/mutase family protein [Planctomycetales bacterium]
MARSPADPPRTATFGLTPVGRGSARNGAGETPCLPLDSEQPLPSFNEHELPLLRDGFIDSHIVMCACPECQAPMSVHLGMLLADCWRCQTSIEVTEELIRELQRQQPRRQQPQPSPQQRSVTAAPVAPATPPSSPSSPKPTAPARSAPSAEAEPARAKSQQAPAPPPPPSPQRRRPPQADATSQAAPATATSRRRAPVRRKSVFDLPPWLISLVFHMVLMTLLALITFPGDDDSPFITLSTEVSKEVREGGEIHAPTDEDLQLDLPLPEDADIDDPRVRKAVLKADQDARELRLDPNTPQMPNLNLVKSQIAQHGKVNASLVARDPRLRVEMVQKEGGTTLTEAAVARGLRWLSQHQSPDGSWSLHRYHHVDGCNCRPAGGTIDNDSAGTSLALLPFLGAGQTHLVGRYRENVSRGLRWLLNIQQPNGDLRGRWHGNSGMYAHGIGAIVLCEAFLLTGDEQLRDPAQRALDFIIKAQNDRGGWRYEPGVQDGDTSVLGWQLMALQSGRAAQLRVPESTFLLSGQFLDLVEQRPNYHQWIRRWSRQVKDGPAPLLELLERNRWSMDEVGLIVNYLNESKGESAALAGMWKEYQSLSRSGGRYGYRPGTAPTHVMTAEALLCRMYLGWNRQVPGMEDGAQYLLDNFMPHTGAPDIYYWYYGTQVFHHLGGAMWDKWNGRMRDVLVSMQETRGHEAGSWWHPGLRHGTGGRLYFTSLAICTLEVYYRHLPIYRQIDLN